MLGLKVNYHVLIDLIKEKPDADFESQHTGYKLYM